MTTLSQKQTDAHFDSPARIMTLHGDRVAYRDEGAGEVLLLIHGVGGCAQSWRALVPRLATRYRVIVPDLLGHGQSDKPRGDYSLGAFAVWLRDFLDALGIAAATVVGHSFGGGVALQFAHQHKAYCRRLVLISSGGLGPDLGRLLRVLSMPGSEFVLPLIASRPALWLGGALRRRALSSGQEVTRYSEALRAHASLANPHTRNAFLRTLRGVVDHRGQAVCALNRLHADLPTLIVFGDQDRCIPVAHAHAAHRAVPGSRLYVIAGAGHQPQLEHAGTVASVIGDFIAESDPMSGQPTSRRAESLSRSESVIDDDAHLCRSRTGLRARSRVRRPRRDRRTVMAALSLVEGARRP